MRRVVFAVAALILAVPSPSFADDPPSAEEDARRAIAVAEFTKKMKDANYPALFDAAAIEFRVPADILKGVSFAETRWEHLTWPPGETRSPETGMPRPFGIMSLWDNEFFGHSLIEAAQLIGKDPEELKTDPFQNIRGGAALLRKIYDETPKPDGTAEADVESWRYAIRKYCGIPEPDLNAQHALDVYTFMSKGYHQYGIEWNARPVKLDPIIAETRKIVADERAKREALHAANPQLQDNPASQPAPKPTLEKTPSKAPPQVAISTLQSPSAPARARNYPWWFILLAFLVLIGATALILKRPKSTK
jgi:hypothetical protein